MMLSFLEYLRGWVGALGFLSIITVVQCYFGQTDLLLKNVYTLSQNVDPLTSRLFALWTLLTAFIRIAFCLDYKNECIFFMTLSTFIITVLHYLLETFCFGTATFTFGIVSPLVLNGLSLLLMLGYYVFSKPEERVGKTSNDHGSARSCAPRRWSPDSKLTCGSTSGKARPDSDASKSMQEKLHRALRETQLRHMQSGMANSHMKRE